MEHLRKDWSKFLEYAKNFISEPLVILDIGCSGGIDRILENFGNKIRYYGFDPNIKEIHRLKEANANPNINYIEAFIYCSDKKYSNHIFSNSSAQAASDILKATQLSETEKVNNNLWDQVELSKNIIHIPEFLKQKNLEYVDFIKSDIDGYDLDFFHQIEEIIDSKKILSIVAEVNFGEDFNDQADLTNLLKKYNFSLNLLSTRNYSSKYLPDLFALNIAAQSISGRISQGDAVYIKNIHIKPNLDPQKLLKIAIIASLFSLDDYAAEILCLFKNEIKATGINIEKALNLLVLERKFAPQNTTYSDFIKLFHEKREIFYPKNYDTKELFKIFKENVAKISDGGFYFRIKSLLNDSNNNSQKHRIKLIFKKIKKLYQPLKNKFLK